MYSHLQQLAVSRLCNMYNVQCTYYDLFNVANAKSHSMHAVYTVCTYIRVMYSHLEQQQQQQLYLGYVLCTYYAGDRLLTHTP